jgi:hypothetical protein
LITISSTKALSLSLKSKITWFALLKSFKSCINTSNFFLKNSKTKFISTF